MPTALSEIIDVVSVIGLLDVVRISGAPQFEQNREVSGLGRLHREQKTLAISPLILPLSIMGSSGSTIASGNVAEGTELLCRGSARRANSLQRPRERRSPAPLDLPGSRRFRHTAASPPRQRAASRTMRAPPLHREFRTTA